LPNNYDLLPEPGSDELNVPDSESEWEPNKENEFAQLVEGDDNKTMFEAYMLDDVAFDMDEVAVDSSNEDGYGSEGDSDDEAGSIGGSVLEDNDDFDDID
jgi:hypothetical protein